MNQFIKLNNAKKRAEICKIYGVSQQALSFALSFKRNSKTAIAMRKMAIENGGVLYEKSEIY